MNARPRVALDDLPADRRGPRHDHEPDRQQPGRLVRIPSNWLAFAPTRRSRRGGRVPALRRAGTARDVPLRDGADRPRRRHHSRRRAGDHLAGGRDAIATIRAEELDIERPRAATSRSDTASTSASGATRTHGRPTRARVRSCTVPGRAPRGPSEELHWGHGDGLVLRGLGALPVVPRPGVGLRRATI